MLFTVCKIIGSKWLQKISLADYNFYAYSKNSNTESYNRLTARWKYLNTVTLKSSIKILANAIRQEK